MVVLYTQHVQSLEWCNKVFNFCYWKARNNDLAIEDMDGGTFTISNGGVFGSLMGTPIINPPQSAILGMHAINDRPVAINGKVIIQYNVVLLFTGVFKTTLPGVVCTIDCLQSHRNFTWMCASSIQSHLKLSFMITDWKHLIQKTILLFKPLKIPRLFLIDGNPLWTTRRKFCLWWPYSFENTGKQGVDGSFLQFILFFSKRFQ